MEGFMKKAVIFSGFCLMFCLILAGSVFSISAENLGDDVVLALSSETNAHAELYNQFHYVHLINYTEIFGWLPPENPHNGGGIVLRLSSDTNAHAQIPKDVCVGTAKKCSDYKHNQGEECNAQKGCYFDTSWWDECKGNATNCEDLNDSSSCNSQEGCSWVSVNEKYTKYLVTYSDLKCRAKHVDEGACNRKNEKCIVKLSSWTNAHLELCDFPGSGYPIQICCSGKVNCKAFTTKQKCNKYDSCAWTPLINPETKKKTTSNADGGGCCDFGKKWDSELNNGTGGCVKKTKEGLCSNPWTSNNIGEVRYENGKWEYCAQVTPGVNTGYWYEIENY